MSDVLITPASKKIEFKDGSSNIDGTIKLDANDNLVLTSANDLILGDGSTDLHIGDGTNSIDMVYDQSGRIYGAANKDITIGKSSVGGNDIIIDSPNWSVSQAGEITSTGVTVTGANESITFDGATKLIGDHSSDGFQIRTQDTDPIVFKTNGNNTRMSIEGDGNVGIGTTSPSQKLEVNGSVMIPASERIYFKSTDTYIGSDNDSSEDLHIGADGHIELEADNDTIIKQGGTELARFTSTGLGIGTTSPAFPLDVNGWIATATGIVHTGDTNNTITFGTDTQSFNTGSTARMNISDSGLQIGAGARVTTILDEDNMATNSATALATQQSIKAYVDANAGGGGGGGGSVDDIEITATNTYIGADVFASTSSTADTGVGGSAGRYLTGGGNTVVGFNAGIGPSSGTVDGESNTAVGTFALSAITTGDRNICIGQQAGDNITTGSDNVIIGGVNAGSATGSDQLVIASGDGGVYWMEGDSSGNIGFPTNAGSIQTVSFASGGGISVAHATQANVQVYDTSSSSNKTDFAQSGSDTYIVNRSSSGSIFLRPGAGGSTKQVKLTNNGHMQFYSNHSSGDKLGIQFIRTDTDTTGGEYLGGISWDSADGNVPSSIDEGTAYIAAYASETHGTGDKGGRIEVGTSAVDDNDDTVSTAHLRIDHGGGRILGTPVTGLGTNTTLTRNGHAGKWLNVTSASVTVTLPQATVEGEQYCILNNNGGTTTVGRATSVTINGASSNKTLTNQYEMKVYMALGTGASTNYIEIG